MRKRETERQRDREGRDRFEIFWTEFKISFISPCTQNNYKDKLTERQNDRQTDKEEHRRWLRMLRTDLRNKMITKKIRSYLFVIQRKQGKTGQKDLLKRDRPIDRLTEGYIEKLNGVFG